MKEIILLVVFTLATSAMDIEQPKTFFDVQNDVEINLYTLKNPTEPQILVINDTNSIEESHFNRNVPTRIFIHGFQSKGELKTSLTEAYFLKGKKNVNLIGVNWEKASRTFNYLAASRYVEKIGTRAAEFVDFMVDNKIIKLTDLTVIGFSLGAHIAGITGKRVRSGKIPKIVGLDPAKPLFSLDKPDERLDSNDATHVETIHTSKLGFFDPLGIVSFYPNGGRSQPGCTWDI
ncbi:lipase member H-like, partial [Sitodiplosis mosellana]|uniref:lipase member H-like n=1 Tax=Sitodiplosis mosellana TaxID=263140 RepID=UPI002443B4F3